MRTIDAAEAMEHPALWGDLELQGLLPAWRSQHHRAERQRVRRVLQTGGWCLAGRSTLALIRPLPWDTTHFGVRCADLVRLYLDPDAPHPEELRPLVTAVVSEARRRDVGLLSARPLTRHLQLPALLIDHGFALVDTSVEIGRRAALPAAPIADGPAVARTALPADRPLLEAMAQTFEDNRFHRDPRLPRERCQQLYRHWVSGALDRGEVTVVEVQGQPAGFCTAYPRDELVEVARTAGPVGTIGLVVIDPRHRGRQLFDPLLRAAARRLGRPILLSSTQLSNTPALRAFGRHGLLPFSSRHVLHAWL